MALATSFQASNQQNEHFERCNFLKQKAFGKNEKIVYLEFEN